MTYGWDILQSFLATELRILQTRLLQQSRKSAVRFLVHSVRRFFLVTELFRACVLSGKRLMDHPM